MKSKFKNYGKKDQTLCGGAGLESIRFEPGAIVEMDPERLKMYLPSDVEDLRPYEPEAAPALVANPAAPDDDPEGVESGELVKLLTQANNVGPQA